MTESEGVMGQETARSAEQVARWFGEAVAASDRIGDDLAELAAVKQPLAPAMVDRLRALADRSEAALDARYRLAAMPVDELLAGVHLWAARNERHGVATLPLWEGCTR